MKSIRKFRIYAHVTEEEGAEITALARQARITVSELVRRLVTGKKLPDSARHEAVYQLGKINADLARLGNLIRMAIDDPEFTPPEGVDLEDLFGRIRSTQSTLKAKIEEL